MRCPGDRTELSPRRYESDIAIDACETCGGAWLDPGELERIQQSLDRDYSAELREVPDAVARAYAQAGAEGAPPRDCPRCQTSLDRSEHGYCSQVLVDVCRRCGGVWLDRGELKALEVFFEQARIDAGALRRGFFGGLAKA